MQTTNLKSARAAILDGISRDIRRASTATQERSLTVEIENWHFLFDQGRYTAAAQQWDTVKRMMQEGN